MKSKKLLIAGLLGVLLLLLSATPSLTGQVSGGGGPPAGYVGVTCEEPVELTPAGDFIDDIVLTEGSPGSFVGSYSSVTLTLPYGFAWRLNDGDTSVSAYTYAEGYEDYYDRVDFYLDNNGRTLLIDNNYSYYGGIEYGSTVTIRGLFIIADESVAQDGDVICQIGGYSDFTPETLKVATYTNTSSANPLIEVTSGNPATIMAGKYRQTIGNIVISQVGDGGQPIDGTITLTLPDGAQWSESRDCDPQDYPCPYKAPSDESYAVSLDWHYGSRKNTIRTTVFGEYSPDVITLKKGMIDLSADFTGDLNVTVGGSAGVAGVVKVATVVAPVTAGLEASPAQILRGVQDQPLPDIFITENRAGAIRPDHGSLRTSDDNLLRLWFPQGVVPTAPTVQVASGNLVIEPSSVCRVLSDNGCWFVQVRIISSGTQASTLKFSNMKVDVGQNVPVGALKLTMNGFAVLETAYSVVDEYYPINPIEAPFPGATAAAAVTAGTVYTTLPVAGSGITVSGLVQLESGYDSGVSVSLVDTSSGTATLQVFTDASGNYQFTDVQPGTYRVVAAHKGFLRAAYGNVSASTSSASVSVPAITMKAGDLTGDNKIDLLDVATFAKNYGSVGN